VSSTTQNRGAKFTSLRSWINTDDILQNNTFSDGQLEKMKEEAALKKAAKFKSH